MHSEKWGATLPPSKSGGGTPPPYPSRSTFMNLFSVRRTCFITAELYNKSELMLMGRAPASVSFRTQVVLVCLQYISAKMHSKCASRPKIAKNSLKNPDFGGSRSFKVIDVGTAAKMRLMSANVNACIID